MRRSLARARLIEYDKANEIVTDRIRVSLHDDEIEKDIIVEKRYCKILKNKSEELD